MASFNPAVNLSFDGAKLSTCTTALPAIMRSWLESVRALALTKARR
jgi:hypothetical protein